MRSVSFWAPSGPRSRSGSTVKVRKKKKILGANMGLLYGQEYFGILDDRALNYIIIVLAKTVDFHTSVASDNKSEENWQYHLYINI